MAEPISEQTEPLIQTDEEEQVLQQSEEKQAVMEVARLVTETEMEQCNNGGLEAHPVSLEGNATTEEVQEVGRAQPASDLAINIMSHMEISRLIANVVKRMQEDAGSQAGVSGHSFFHMENLLKQIVTNQNTITINQNSLLRNQQAVIQKVDTMNNLMLAVMGNITDSRLNDKASPGLKTSFHVARTPRAGSKRSFPMDGTDALVQAAEQVSMMSAGSPQVGGVSMSIAQNLNGIAEAAMDSVSRQVGDEEQGSFGTPQASGVLSTISPSAIYLATGGMLPDHMTMQPSGSGELNDMTLIRLKAKSQSVGNFAVHLVREMFKPHDMLGKNVSGTRNKDKLDADKVAKIRKYVFDLFPTSGLEEDKVWSDCRKAMDEFLRRPNKRKSQDKLAAEWKKDKLAATDSPVMGSP